MTDIIMKTECLFCKAPLEYITNEELMECVICHKKEKSNTRCTNGHYVCNECHTSGVEMKADKVQCIHNHKNNQCLKEKCPYFTDGEA